LEQVPAWVVYHNAVALHSAVSFRAPLQYREEVIAVAPLDA
jgi:hypothetical protein